MISVGDLQHFQSVANEGSPALLKAAGRMFGLADAERAALSTSGVPWWTWLTIGVAVGFIAGVRADAEWPEKMPKIVRGR